MPRPYSNDLRERALALVAKGQSRSAVARLLGLAESTVINWAKRKDLTGDFAAKPMGGKRKALLLPERDWLLARVSAVPDVTVRALRAELADRDVKVCVDTVWRFLMAEGLTFKKKVCGPPSRTVLTSPASASAGGVTKVASTPTV